MFESAVFVSCGKFTSRSEWIHPDRVINSYEIIMVIEGEVNINEEGKDYYLKKNDILILEPNLRHMGFKKSLDTSFYWMHYVCDKNLLEGIKVLHTENPYNLFILANQLIHYSVSCEFPEMLDYLIRLIIGEIKIKNKNSFDNKLVNEIHEWIRINSDRMIKSSDICEKFGYNSDYISRLFKKHCGKNLKTVIDENKIDYIKNLLIKSNKSLNEISASCGFEEYKYFLKFFKYHENITPTEFKRAYTKTHIINK